MTAVGLFKGRRLVTPGNTPDLDFFKVSLLHPTCAQADLANCAYILKKGHIKRSTPQMKLHDVILSSQMHAVLLVLSLYRISFLVSHPLSQQQTSSTLLPQQLWYAIAAQHDVCSHAEG